MNISKISKIILLTSGYIFLLILYLNNNNQQLWGIILDAYWLTFISILYIIFLLKLTGLILKRSYYAFSSLEQSLVIYSILGVKPFKKIIQKYPVPITTRKIKLKGKSKSNILLLEKEIKVAEEIHVWGLLLTVFISIIFSIFKDIGFLLWLTIFNIITNLYPILLQRYNRNRIKILLNKYKLYQVN